MKKQASDLRRANIADLIANYFEGTGALGGAKTIDSSEDENLNALLRSHLLRGITSDEEIEARAQIDDLLAFYSLLEIGILTGALEEQLPREIHGSAERHLTRPAVRRYYEKFYPLFLPQLFLRRLQDNPASAESAPSNYFVSWSEPSNYFVSFLEVNEMLGSEEVETFLWFLDDGFVDDTGLEDVLRVLDDPEKFTRRMLRPPPKQTALDQALRGMIQFFEFCANFDKLLKSAQDPLIQSASWHYHGYWFQQIGGQVHGVISTAIEQYRTWVPGPDDPLGAGNLDAIQATHTSMDTIHRALQRLTSAIYRSALEQLLLKDKDDSTQVEADALEHAWASAKAKAAAKPEVIMHDEPTQQHRTEQGLSA
jgi:hypothetical protein